MDEDWCQLYLHIESVNNCHHGESWNSLIALNIEYVQTQFHVINVSQWKFAMMTKLFKVRELGSTMVQIRIS